MALAWPAAPTRASRSRMRTAELALSRRRVYVLPTRAGLLYAAVVATMLVASINYALALGYALTFLLAALGLVSMLHTWRNLAHLVLRAGRADPVHAGELADFGLVVRNSGPLERWALELSVPDTAQLHLFDVGARAEPMISVALPTARRGWLEPPIFTIATRYPLGLWRAWAYWTPAARVLVYPQPESPAAPLPESAIVGGGAARARAGDDDLAAIRPYRAGDSPRRVAWKAMARTGSETPLTLQFEGGWGGELELDWFALPSGLDTEARLRRLTRWVVDADAAGLRYALRLPDRAIAVDGGPAHRAACLEALALAVP